MQLQSGQLEGVGGQPPHPRPHHLQGAQVHVVCDGVGWGRGLT